MDIKSELDLNNFCVAYNTGYYGSWLVWFISNHRDFAPVGFDYGHAHFNTPNKVSSEPIRLKLHSHEWVYEAEFYDPNEYEEDDPEIDLEDYIALHHEFEKFCYKVKPSAPWNHNNDSKLRNKILANSRYICLVFDTNQDIVLRRLEKWSWDWVGADSTTQYIEQCNREARTCSKLTDGLLLDMGALLGPDSNKALDEYWNLLYYIEAPGMKNWQDLLVEVK